MQSEGLDRARPKAFIAKLPKGTRVQLDFREKVEDHQLLLHETWQDYCDRTHKDMVRHEHHQKWVTETWEQWERRVILRDESITNYFSKQDAKDVTEAARLHDAEVRADKLQEHFAATERARRKADRLPKLHTMLQHANPQQDARDADARR
eukprot:gene360-2412_t